MNRIRRGNRILAAALSALLAANGLPGMALAGENARESCGHHKEHTAGCGFAEAMPCQHEHKEDCYSDELVCGFAADTTASDREAEHAHTQECRKPDCLHERGEHDDACGYAEAQPCGFICQESHDNASTADTEVKTLLEQGPVNRQSDLSEKSHYITLSPDSIIFPSVNEGYTVGSTGDVAPRTVTVNVAGSSHDTSLSATLDDPGDEAFEVKGNIGWEGGENGKFSVVTIEPKSGLTAGTYEGTLTVKGSDTNPVTAPVSFTVNSTSAFVGVTSIREIPTTMTAGTPLTLTGTVEPPNATNKAITWSVEDAGGTGAAISGNTLFASSEGVVIVKATIPNGKTETTPFEETFRITVNPASSFVSATNIKGVPTSMTAGTPLTLTGTVEPPNATNKAITWSVEDAGGTDAAFSGNTLSASSAGVVIVKATIPNGKTETTPFEETFRITVNPASSFVSATNIKGVPTSMTAGTPLTLTGTVEPPNATNKVITWSVEDAGSTGANLNGNVLSAENAGTVKVMATIAGNTPSTPFTQFFSVEVRRRMNPAPDSVTVTGNSGSNDRSGGSDSSGGLLLTKSEEDQNIDAILISRIVDKTRDKMNPLAIFDENGTLIEGSVIMIGTTPHRITVSDNAPDQETIDRLCGMIEGKKRLEPVFTLEFVPVDSNATDNLRNVITPISDPKGVGNLTLALKELESSSPEELQKIQTMMQQALALYETQADRQQQTEQKTPEQQQTEQESSEQKGGHSSKASKDYKNSFPFQSFLESGQITVGEAGPLEMVVKIEPSILSVELPTYTPYTPSDYFSHDTDESDKEEGPGDDDTGHSNTDGQDQKQEQPSAVLMKVEGVTPDSHIAALHRKNGQWVQEYALAGNGSVLMIGTGVSTVSLVADRSTLAK